MGRQDVSEHSSEVQTSGQSVWGGVAAEQYTADARCHARREPPPRPELPPVTIEPHAHSTSNAESNAESSATGIGYGGEGGQGGNSSVSFSSSDFIMDATQAPAVLPGAPAAASFEYIPGDGSSFSAASNASIDTTSGGVNVGIPGVAGFGFGYGESRASHLEPVRATSAQQETAFAMFISNTADPRLDGLRLEIQRRALSEVQGRAAQPSDKP